MPADTAAPWTADPYANAVVDVLAGDFPDLADPMIAGIIRKHVYTYTRVKDRLEVILDEPFVASWRLIGHTGRVQVACYRLHRTDADLARAERLNAALDALLDITEEG